MSGGPSATRPGGSAVVASPSAVASPAAYTLGHFPDAPTSSLPNATTAALQAVLDSAIERGRGLPPGITASVIVGGRGIWAGAAGTADEVHPVETASQFGIASITKTVIAAEIMRLSEQGVIKLTDPVATHLPEDLAFDTNGATIRDLLAMETGMPDPVWPDGPGTDQLREWTPQEVLDTVASYRNEPGESWSYSSTGYILLGLVIEEVTGMSVADALRSHVLADPRLSALVYQPEEQPNGPLALPFLGTKLRAGILEAGGGYVASKATASALGSAGGMASDAPTLALWAYLLAGGHLVSQASLEAMTDFGLGESYDRYGLGLFDRASVYGVPAFGTKGQDSAGYVSSMVVVPGEGMVITVLMNTEGDVDPVATGLWKVLVRDDG